VLREDGEPASFGLPFSTPPEVISQVHTKQDDNWGKARQQNIASTGFDMGLDQDEDTKKVRSSETSVG
jgi:hypothetical protein